MFQFRGSSLPIFYGVCTYSGFALCLYYAYTKHFKEVTGNHCRGPEFWPSISATIGDHSPEKNIYRYAMALGSGARILSTFINYDLFKEEQATTSWKRLSLFNNLAFIFDIMRIFTAGMWIYVSSSEHLFTHEVSFVGYVLFSMLFMIVHTILFYKAKASKPRAHPVDQASFKWKLGLAIPHCTLFFASLHFFFQHTLDCVPYGILSYCSLASVYDLVVHERSGFEWPQAFAFVV